MLLAVTSLEVAFASAIVAGIAALGSPILSWRITKAQLREARANRIYDDKREAYRIVVVDLFKGKYYVQDWIEELTNNEVDSPLTIMERYDARLTESVDDAIKRSAEISIFGPDSVVKAHRDFIEAWNAGTAPVTPPTRFTNMDEEEIRAAALKTLTVALEAMQEPMEKLRIACHDDLCR